MSVTTQKHLDVSAAGLLLGTAAFLFPLYQLKPNRVAEGDAYWALFSGQPLLPLLFAAFTVVLTLLVLHRQWRGEESDSSPALDWMLRIWAICAFILPWVFLHRGAGSTITEEGLELGRAAPSGGLWLTLLAGYVVVHAYLAKTRRAWIDLLPAILVLLGLPLLVVAGFFEHVSFALELLARRARFFQEFGNHLTIAGTAVGSAILIGVPSGILAFRYKSFGRWILNLASTVQTIPSLAMFGLLIAPMALLSRAVPVLREIGITGVGAAPAIVALTLYSLLPIVRNTYTGLAVVPAAVVESGNGMGMTRRQLFSMVELPTALPVLLTGIRVAAVQAIGNTTVAALIGAGGFGRFVFQGIGQAAPDLIVLGVIPTVLLAVGVDRLFALLVRTVQRAPE
jgi:osmoprotectant transport system permease protein